MQYCGVFYDLVFLLLEVYIEYYIWVIHHASNLMLRNNLGFFIVLIITIDPKTRRAFDEPPWAKSNGAEN